MSYKRLCYGLLVVLILCLPFIPAFFSDSSAEQAKSKFDEGKTLAIAGDLDAAIPCYSEAIKLNPQFAEAYIQRGLTYADLGMYEKAIQDCTEAIKLNPDDPGYYYVRRSIHLNNGRHREARADYEMAESIWAKERGDD
jgi:tetratricopeptide (TPR) repeat protein